MRQGCKVKKIRDISLISCGGEPTDHICNERDIVHGFSDGFNGTLFEKARNEKINLNMCDKDKIHFLAEKDIHIISSSVACSICGRAAIDNAYWL